MNSAILVAFLIYFAILIAIGIISYRGKSSTSEFIIGNRSTNYWITAISAQASDMGSWLFLGFPAAVYTKGVFEWWTAIGLIFFMYIIWTAIAPRLRIQTEKLNSLTLSSFLNAHFQDKQGKIGFFAALFSIFFFTFYIAAGLVGLSLLFSHAFSISYQVGIIISLFTVLLFTLLGGYVAVVWSNLFQGIFLLCSLIAVFCAALIKLPNFSSLISVAQENHIPLTLISSYRDMGSALFLACSWGIGYFGQPHILVNFMGIDDPMKLTYAKRVGISWMSVALFTAAALGIIGLGYFPSLHNPETLFIELAMNLFPSFIAGLILCGILAANLSSMDTQILISGSTFAEDIINNIMRVKNSAAMLWYSRIGSLLVAFVSLLIAWHTSTSVYSLVNYAWSGLGSCFGPIVIAALYMPSINRHGALAGMITGGVVAMIWPLTNSSILPLLPGFFANGLIMASISYFYRIKNKNQST